MCIWSGKTYRLRISNVGVATSLNFRIAGHNLTVVETEGSHTQQLSYENLDIHVGQSYSVLVTLNRSPGAYYMVASSRFTNPVINGIAVVQYSNSGSRVSGPLPPGPTIEIDYSVRQARTIKYASKSLFSHREFTCWFMTAALMHGSFLLNSCAFALGKLCEYSSNKETWCFDTWLTVLLNSFTWW